MSIPSSMPSSALSPPVIVGDLVRPRLLDLLERRWDHAVTTVVAGAGFGKSIAIGQALRANQTRPRGIEAWVSCRSRCEDPDRLVDSILTAFGVQRDVHGSPRSRLHAAIDALAPVDTVLVLDDVEMLTAAPACVHLINQLLGAAPANFHLVACGRELPAFTLARVRAAGQVAALTGDDLRFTSAEVAALAAGTGHAHLMPDLGGWPALVRLALTAPVGTIGDFLWEEVIRALPEEDRRTLFALTVLGPTGAADAADVSGHAFDPDDFCSRVPLVHQADGRLVAHDLWGPALTAVLPGDEIDAVSRRALAVVEARGDVITTGSLAARLGHGPCLRRSAVDLVRVTLASLPVDVATAWLLASSTIADRDSYPHLNTTVADTPELQLLAIARAHALVASDPPAAALDAVIERFTAAGNRGGHAVTMALATLVAEANHDLGRLLVLAQQVRAVAGADGHPVLRLLLNSVDAAVATLSGDLPRALAILEQPVDDVARHDRPEAMTRLHWHLLLLAGRAADAAILAEPAATPANSAVPVRELTATARWFDGDPSGFAVGAVELGPDRYVALSERDRFDQAALVAVMAAAAGEVKAVDEAVAVLQSSPFANTTPPDAAFVAVARAAQLVLVGDEDAAARVLDELLDTFGFGPDGYVDRLTDAHLRRALCVPYVCSPRLRAVWDDAELGPSQRRARAIAGLLLDAREGRAIKDPPHGSLSAMSTLLPLPWSVELAARAAAAGAGWGINLAGVLADRYGDTFEGCLGDLLTSPDRTVASGACILRAALPVAPSATLRIEVVGSLQVRLDDRPIDSPELRRTRVRQLLCALAVERTVTRDRIMDLLWPELDIDKARTNLRVTLTHLQRLLEPHRRPGEAPYFVRSDALALRLVDVPGLEVDLWEIDRHLDCAEAARGRGDATTRLEHLGAVTGAWRGRPVPDLDAVAGLDRAGPHVTTRLIEATLSLGELELVRGNATDAAERAEQVLVADPYHERAHRLAIASRLHSRDHTATAAAVGRLRAMLDDLGLGTDDATRMLLHQADRQNR